MSCLCDNIIQKDCSNIFSQMIYPSETELDTVVDGNGSPELLGDTESTENTHNSLMDPSK